MIVELKTETTEDREDMRALIAKLQKVNEASMAGQPRNLVSGQSSIRQAIDKEEHGEVAGGKQDEFL